MDGDKKSRKGTEI
jgi:hypothetical protein